MAEGGGGGGGAVGAGSETDGGDPKSPQLPVQRERERERETGNVGSDGPTFIRPSVSCTFLRNEIIECLAPHNVAQD